MAFLPGSSRPNYPGLGYEVIAALGLEALLEHDAEDDLVTALIGSGGSGNGMANQTAATRRETEAFLAAHPRSDHPCPYGREAIGGLVLEAADCVAGDLSRGRHGWAVRSATRAVELIRSGCASADDLDLLGTVLDRIKPEGGTDWLGVTAWAITNAQGVSACAQHQPGIPTCWPATAPRSHEPAG